nr:MULTISPECIES: helix-turn-helix domain-containing protein [unclassified Sphingomonas]
MGADQAVVRLGGRSKSERAALAPGTIALSKQETAEVLGVSIGTVNNLMSAGTLAYKKIGRRVLVQAESVRAYMA